jgi:hypothetical protein
MKSQKTYSKWAVLACAFTMFAPQASHAAGAADAAKKVSAYSAAVNESTQAILKAAKDAGLAVPKQVYAVTNHINKTTGKISNAAGVISGVQQQVKNFQEADALTKVEMRCDSKLTYLKSAANKIGYNLNNYLSARKKICSIVPYVARAQQAYETYKSIQKNGLPLIQKHHKKKHNFPAGRKRTTNLWIDVRYMPNEKKIQYAVDFKWSDDKVVQIIPPPMASNDEGKKGICIPINSFAKFCFKVVSATSSQAKIDLWATVDRYNKTKTLSFGKVTVPAPFGYLEQLEQFKEKKKQEAVEKMKTKLVKLAGIDKETQSKIQKLAGMVVKINQ